MIRPRAHQKAALADIQKVLKKHARAHVVMPCGSGKTLVALWAAERANAKRILVPVPTLALLQQTLREWKRHSVWGADLSYICVCSDPTVDTEDDTLTINSSDSDFVIDTDPSNVRRFLLSSAKIKVVFVTYYSSKIVGAGAQGLASGLNLTFQFA